MEWLRLWLMDWGDHCLVAGCIRMNWFHWLHQWHQRGPKESGRRIDVDDPPDVDVAQQPQSLRLDIVQGKYPTRILHSLLSRRIWLYSNIYMNPFFVWRRKSALLRGLWNIEFLDVARCPLPLSSYYLHFFIFHLSLLISIFLYYSLLGTCLLHQHRDPCVWGMI